MGTADLLTQLDDLHARYRVANKISPRRDWYAIENRAGTATIRIYDEIGWFGVTANEFVQEVEALDAAAIDLHINSPGGEVFDGLAIYSALRQHPASVNVIIDSLAASIASVIAMAGDTVSITPNGMMMIHDGHGLAIGNAADHREMAELLDKVSDNIASVYADRAGGVASDWRARMTDGDGTWFNASEALEAGLADRLTTDTAASDPAPPVAADFDLHVFNTPDPDPTLDPAAPSFDAAGFANTLRKALA